jgi:hypothetical protein
MMIILNGSHGPNSEFEEVATMLLLYVELSVVTTVPGPNVRKADVE